MIYTFEDNEELVTIQSQEEDAVVTTVIPANAGVQVVDITELETLIQTAEEPVIFQTTEEVSNTFETSPPRGLKGEPGAAAGTTVEYPIAYAVSGHRMVVLNEDQEVIYADNTIVAHANKILGMTIGAATVGNVFIQSGGELTEPSWSWTLDVPIWLSTNGLLTQTVPVSGFSLIIGFPVTATKIFINIREPIFLI